MILIIALSALLVSGAWASPPDPCLALTPAGEAVCVPPEGRSYETPTCAAGEQLLIWDFFYGRNSKNLFCNYAFPMETMCVFHIDQDPVLKMNVERLLAANGQQGPTTVELDGAIGNQCGNTSGFLLYTYTCIPHSGVSAGRVHWQCETLDLDQEIDLCPSPDDSLVTIKFSEDTTFRVYQDRTACLTEESSGFCEVTPSVLRSAGCLNSATAATDCTARNLLLHANCDPARYVYALARLDSVCHAGAGGGGSCPDLAIVETEEPATEADAETSLFETSMQDCFYMTAGDHPDPGDLWSEAYFTCQTDDAASDPSHLAAVEQTCADDQVYLLGDSEGCGPSPLGELCGVGDQMFPVDLSANPCFNDVYNCDAGALVPCTSAGGDLQLYSPYRGECVVPDQECELGCKPVPGPDPEFAPELDCVGGTQLADGHINLLNFVNFVNTDAPAEEYWFRIFFHDSRLINASYTRTAPAWLSAELLAEYHGAKLPLGMTEDAVVRGFSDSMYFYLKLSVSDTSAFGQAFADPDTVADQFSFTYNRAWDEACDAGPCQNGGTCKNTWDDDYVCNCPGTFGGRHCETEVCAPCKDPGNAVFTVESVEGCADESHYYDGVTGQCFFYYDRLLTHESAENVCANNGAVMMPIYDQHTLQLAGSLTAAAPATYSFWTGNRRTRSGFHSVSEWQYLDLSDPDPANHAYTDFAGDALAFLTAAWDTDFPAAGYGRDVMVLVRDEATGELRLQNSEFEESRRFKPTICTYKSTQATAVERIGMCEGSGDTHYYTFDGTRASFYGVCDYDLFTLGDHTVTVSQRAKLDAPPPGYSFITGLYYTSGAGGQVVHLSEEDGVTVDGRRVMLPYKSELGGFCVQRCGGDNTAITTNAGFQVNFSPHLGNKVSVFADQATVAGISGGICGNFDGAEDDLSDIQASFKNDDNYEGGCGAAPAAPPNTALLTCLDVDTTYADYQAFCDSQLGLAGAACWDAAGRFPQTTITDQCALDVCKLGEGALVATGTHVAAVCHAEQVLVDDAWGQDALSGDPIAGVLACGANEVYADCASACPASCLNPAVTCEEAACIAGCVCAAGHLRDGLGNCVLEAQCGCFSEFNSPDTIGYHPIGSQLVAGACGVEAAAVCECVARDTLVCANSGCAPDAECVEGEPSFCRCGDGFMGNGFSQCVPQSFCEFDDGADCDVSADQILNGYLHPLSAPVTESVVNGGSSVIITPLKAIMSELSLLISDGGESSLLEYDDLRENHPIVINRGAFDISTELPTRPSGYQFASIELLLRSSAMNACELGGNEACGDATCIPELVGFSCGCDIGFYGEFCQLTTGNICEEVGETCNGNGDCRGSTDPVTDEPFYLCDCNQGYSGSRCQYQSGITLICEKGDGPNNFFVAVDYSLLASGSTRDLVLVSGEESCLMTRQTGGYFSITYDANSCGTERVVENTADGVPSVFYRNRIVYADTFGDSAGGEIAGEGDLFITRESNWYISLECCYTAEDLVHSSFSTREDEGQKVSGANQLQFQLRATADSGFNSFPSSSPTFQPGDPVYMQAALLHPPPGLTISARTCWASTSADPADLTRFYPLQQDRCPADDTFVRDSLAPSHLDNFHFEAFAVVGESLENPVWVHCELFVCTPDNADECQPRPDCDGGQGRARREAHSFNPVRQVSSQPMLFLARGPNALPAVGSEVMMALVGALTLLATVVAVLFVTLVRAMRAARRRSYAPLRELQE